MSNKKINKVCIIGSGPAGYTAAIYCARAMLNPVMITGINSGGQLMTTIEVENYPGYENITGPEIIENMRSQAENHGTRFIHSDVKSINCSKYPFEIELDEEKNNLYYSKSIIIATGASANWLNLPGEEKLHGKGVSTCATCDGAFYKGKKLIVVGGGDSAMEEALFLTRYSNNITIIHRSNNFKASKILFERAKNNPSIFWKEFTTVKKWNTDKFGYLESCLLNIEEKNENKQTEEKFDCDGAFLAIGHKPATGFLNNQIETDQNGYILCKEHTMTSIPGIFACGDVTDTRYKQAITAAGQGCKAALDVERWLSENN